MGETAPVSAGLHERRSLGQHLSRAGSTDLTSALSDVHKITILGFRWLTFPPYLAPIGQTYLGEDTDTSLPAIRNVSPT
jgi:hypothetical protein